MKLLDSSAAGKVTYGVIHLAMIVWLETSHTGQR
jgi:hypothetical protein